MRKKVSKFCYQNVFPQGRKWKDDAWFPAAEIKFKMERAEITNLELGQSYAFRVR